MTATYEDLRQRVIDGDQSVTPAQLDKAKRDHEFTDLQREGEREAARRAQEATLEAQRVAVRADAEALRTASETLLAHKYATALDAARDLRRAMEAHNAAVEGIIGRGRRLDVPEASTSAVGHLKFNIRSVLDDLAKAGRIEGYRPDSRLHANQDAE